MTKTTREPTYSPPITKFFTHYGSVPTEKDAQDLVDLRKRMLDQVELIRDMESRRATPCKRCGGQQWRHDEHGKCEGGTRRDVFMSGNDIYLPTLLSSIRAIDTLLANLEYMTW